ncbi:hypothetical protein [Sphingomonas qomolangmaensis]|uniref:HTH HARE-type domain-containing protein n=1 Tax=Sphingomonas qomolangmaensis TaxID=2918765 RepID=A0ABY5L526_9SPHN|nr:hypothetical protein [Sphingomonas qomolangmaensis]UUL81897.1 hypothetical protein NMP03_11940 [Sphingomonas qomolangmaensis]
MDDLLRQAYERRERLRRELAALDVFIANSESIASGPSPDTRANYEFRLEPPSASRGRAVRTPNLNKLYEAAEQTILQAGKPLSRSELLKRLEQQGFSFPGTDKVKVFGTNLWRSRRFISLKGFGYWPETHPLPAAYGNAEPRASMLKANE